MAKHQEDSQQMRVKDRIELSLLQTRRLFLSDTVDNQLAEKLIKKLWYLEAQDPQKPILLVISSPGGSIDAGFAIWDQLKMSACPITTLVTGIAASMASVLALAASPGRRFATPKSRVMIHQPAIGGLVQGQATDIEIHAREILKMKQHIVDIYVQATGNPPDVVEKSIDRDMWMTAAEALRFGHFDKIISSYKELE